MEQYRLIPFSKERKYAFTHPDIDIFMSQQASQDGLVETVNNDKVLAYVETWVMKILGAEASLTETEVPDLPDGAIGDEGRVLASKNIAGSFGVSPGPEALLLETLEQQLVSNRVVFRATVRARSVGLGGYIAVGINNVVLVGESNTGKSPIVMAASTMLRETGSIVLDDTKFIQSGRVFAL